MSLHKDDTQQHLTPPLTPHPASLPSTFYLVLCVAFSPFRSICLRRHHHHPTSRHHPRRRMGDIPLLLAPPRPKVVATNT